MYAALSKTLASNLSIFFGSGSGVASNSEADGEADGDADGEVDGAADGEADGEADGAADGEDVGEHVACAAVHPPGCSTQSPLIHWQQSALLHV